jgi:protein Mpv17
MGFIALSIGGAFPPRGSGDGKRGATDFGRNSKGGSVSFKGSSAAPSKNASQAPAILKAAYTCAGLGVVGDLLAQTITKRGARKASCAVAAVAVGDQKGGKGSKQPKPTAAASVERAYDFIRTARQMAYNGLFYGPAQFFWYAGLAKSFPTAVGAALTANLPPFAMKVFLNQAVLGPVVVSTFFLWTMTLQGKAGEYQTKMKKDALPALRRGWAFWIPVRNFPMFHTRRLPVYCTVWSTAYPCQSRIYTWPDRLTLFLSQSGREH